MNRKTALILASAVGLIVAAVLLGHKRDASQSVSSSGRPMGGPVPAACGKGGTPARATADFGHGTAVAALSTSRIMHEGNGEVHVSFDLSARDVRGSTRPPLNLAIVVDRSGSMDGEKLDRAKQAAAGIVSSLGPNDRGALVQYDDTAQVVMASTRMDDTGKARLQAAISGLYSGGSTNLHGGMILGRDEVLRELAPGRTNRVILLSDGLANVGIQDTPTLARIAADAAEKGVRLTTVGVGLDYAEDLMEAIAEGGRGNYYYVRDAEGLASVFAGEMRALQATIATHAELRLEPACAGVEIVEVYGYNSRRDGAGVVIPLSDIFGGDHRKVVARLRVPVGLLGAEDVLTARLSFDEVSGGAHRVTDLALGLEITADSAAVVASADKEVMRQVLEVEAARALRDATAAYERGDVTGAQAANRAARARAEQQVNMFALPAASATQVYDRLDSQNIGMGTNAPGSAGGKDLIKGTKTSARQLSK